MKNVLLEKITVDSCYSAQGAALAVMGLNVTLKDSVATRNSSPMGMGAMTFTGRGHSAETHQISSWRTVSYAITTRVLEPRASRVGPAATSP